MTWTITDALQTDDVTNPRKLLGTYQLQIGALETKVTIRLWEQIGEKGVFFDQSHHIKTPAQVGAYRTSRPWNDYEASALHQAINGLTSYYRTAVERGHDPDESWLVPNKNFT